MNNESTINCPGQGSRGRGRLARFFLLGWVASLVSGCGAEGTSGTIHGFLQDFARQALAAWLL
jgi:hypothetical protein